MLLLMLLLFAYYAGYDIDSLLPREAVAPLAAAIVLVCVAVAARSLPEIQPDDVRSWAAPAVALLLLLLPVGYWLVWDEPVAEQGTGGPVRVMSYNLHQGFGIDGRLELEELAKVIEAEGADVVALQEVSRGWVVDGSVDMLVWLSNRLDMVYEWGPAADSVWGNAVLSRYPLSDGETRPMPNNAELRLKRALTSVQVHVGNGQTLNVIVTHLTHSAGTSAQRLDQVNAILDIVGDLRPTVVMGDMNARPHDAEMVRLQDAGLVDAFVASGAPGPGYTSRPDDPVKRIDYIWMSPDLAAGDFSIAPSRASDHLPIAVTVSR
jgi:endonuclease/exonuclease/phosphatase family metal-dependent hydrolase